MSEQKKKKVYEAIAAVQGDLAKKGIAKNRKNQQQGYPFRGIDDIYNELAGLLSKHGLCILPRVLSREVKERTTTKGGVIFYVVLDVEYDFVSTEDGSTHIVRVCGEAMDTSDKATNKAMSAAYKYACLQVFCIPTEGDNDADPTTHPPIAAEEPKKPLLPGSDEWQYAIMAYRRDGNLDAVKSRRMVSPEIEQKIIKEAQMK